MNELHVQIKFFSISCYLLTEFHTRIYYLNIIMVRRYMYYYFWQLHAKEFLTRGYNDQNQGEILLYTMTFGRIPILFFKNEFCWSSKVVNNYKIYSNRCIKLWNNDAFGHFIYLYTACAPAYSYVENSSRCTRLNVYKANFVLNIGCKFAEVLIDAVWTNSAHWNYYC